MKAMHKQFKKDSPQGVVTKHEFTDVMNQMGIQDKFLQVIFPPPPPLSLSCRK